LSGYNLLIDITKLAPTDYALGVLNKWLVSLELGAKSSRPIRSRNGKGAGSQGARFVKC